MPGTSPGTTPVRRLETIPGISTHLANAGVQPRPWLPRSLSPSCPGRGDEASLAPTSRPSTSFYVERLYVAGAEFRPRPGDLRLHQGCPDRPTKDVDARDKPGHDAGRAIGNHSRDIDASRKLGSATATGLPRSLTVMAGHRPGHPRPSTSRGVCCPHGVQTASSSDLRLHQRVPRPADKGRGWPGPCPAMTERVISLAMLGTQVMARRGNGALLRADVPVVHVLSG